MKYIGLVFILFSLSACTHQSKKLDATEPINTGMADQANPEAVAPTKAQAVLKTQPGSKLKGLIHFTEKDGVIKVQTMVEGLKPGPHGFHIHEVGDCSAKDFSSAGGHFNPTQEPHAGHDSKSRHVGDLGNLIANNKGTANTTITLENASFSGPNSILGRSVIIHQDKDDLKSQPAGNSGPRIACGIIQSN